MKSDYKPNGGFKKKVDPLVERILPPWVIYISQPEEVDGECYIK